MSYKKIVSVTLILLLGTLSGGAIAQTVTLVSGNTYAYNDGSSTTNYDISTALFNGGDATAITTNNPWWSSQSTANLFAASVAGNLGTPNLGNGPLFQYQSRFAAIYNTGNASTETVDILSTLGPGGTYAVATTSSAGVPEIDGALAPKAGFLLGCLFLMFGRKRQDLAPASTA